MVLTSFTETDDILHDIGLQGPKDSDYSFRDPSQPKQSDYRVFSIFLLSAETRLKHSLERIVVADQAFCTNRQRSPRPVIIICLEDSKDRRMTGMRAFTELLFGHVLGPSFFVPTWLLKIDSNIRDKTPANQARSHRLINSTAPDLSSIPILPVASYTVLPAVLGWLEMWGLDPRFSKTLPLELRFSEDDKPPWLCTIDHTNSLLPRSVKAFHFLQSLRRRQFLGQSGPRPRGLVIAKAGRRVFRKEGQVKVEMVVTFLEKEYIL